jgi:quinol monooxygenase YgiN
MNLTRREFVFTAGAAAVATIGVPFRAAPRGGRPMYGLIGRMKAVPGRRDALVAILLEGTGEMPGCLSYVVATDPSDADVVWITEVWESQAAHQASLSLPAVREAIGKGRPLIAGFDQHVVTTPVGGYGLQPAA